MLHCCSALIDLLCAQLKAYWIHCRDRNSLRTFQDFFASSNFLDRPMSVILYSVREDCEFCLWKETDSKKWKSLKHGQGSSYYHNCNRLTCVYSKRLFSWSCSIVVFVVVWGWTGCHCLIVHRFHCVVIHCCWSFCQADYSCPCSQMSFHSSPFSCLNRQIYPCKQTTVLPFPNQRFASIFDFNIAMTTYTEYRHWQ